MTGKLPQNTSGQMTGDDRVRSANSAKSKKQVVYSIKNSGKGIPKQDLARIFDRFNRGDPSRTHENGSYGLGLSIAKTILDRLGGGIHAESVENEYTVFTFTLSA